MHHCTECDYGPATINTLARHYGRKHKLPTSKLHADLFHGGTEPTCKCGCGEVTMFLGAVKGFADWKRGHKNRIVNNWGHNKKAQAKSLETRRDMFASGELTTWNTGLTKETDERVAAYGMQQRKTETPQRREEKREMMKAHWEEGRIVPLAGPDHSQWAGGVSELQPLCRSHLHKAWAYPKLRAANFKCTRCKSSEKLCVHHDGERFSPIMRRIAYAFGFEPDCSFDVKKAIAVAIVDYHLSHDVSGVVLCHGCHDLAHREAA